MTYDETMAKATEFKIMLKSRSRNRSMQTPFEVKAKELTRINYTHNIFNNGITIMAYFDDNNKMFTYVCEDDIVCIDMVAALSKQMSIEYTEAKELERMKRDSLIF